MADEEELRVGKSITIGSGPLKGYRGVIKSINKDRIEVHGMDPKRQNYPDREQFGPRQDSQERDVHDCDVRPIPHELLITLTLIDPYY